MYAGRINGLKQAMERVKESGICYEKMKMQDKILMKMASAMLKKKSDKSDFEKGFEQALSQSYDISSESYAEPLIDYVMQRS